jgi:hypothetical protein
MEQKIVEIKLADVKPKYKNLDYNQICRRIVVFSKKLCNMYSTCKIVILLILFHEKKIAFITKFVILFKLVF